MTGPVIDEVSTTRPLADARSSGRHAATARIWLSTFTAKTSRRSAYVISASGLFGKTPALRHNTSRPPSTDEAAATSCSDESGEAESRATASTVCPARVASPRNFSTVTSVTVRAVSRTSCPARTNVEVMAAPMPRVPPTTATFLAWGLM